MSSAVFISYENRLAEVVREPGGVKIDTALRQAAANLETLRDEGLAELDRLLARIETLALDASQVPASRDGLYQAANEAIGVAGVVGLADLGEACRSLCELVDRLRQRREWNVPAVQVHLSALPLLRREEQDEDRSSVLAGLRQVVERF